MSSVKDVVIGERPVTIAGNDYDPYFQDIRSFAAETGPLYSFVKHTLPSDAFILDVGGNIGLTSIAMAHALPQARIAAFEPSPVNAELFAKNTAYLTNVSLQQKGVSDETGTLKFVMTTAGANCHFVTSEYEYINNPDFKPISVPVVTLDEFCQDLDPEISIQFIKIDVEGFEPNVLLGARAMLMKHRPLIWMEFNSVAINVAHGYSPIAFARGLFDHFDVFELKTDLSLVEISSAAQLVHDNMTTYRSIQDIILRPRSEISLSLHDFTQPGRDRA